MVIPLFDLDNTLLKGDNKAHADSFAWAFRTIYGVEASIAEIVTEGLTDNEIILEVLKLHGLGPDAVEPKLPEAAQAMVEYFLKHEDEGEYVPLEGTLKILAELRRRAVPVGLLTGNVEGIAWRKCKKADIRHFIDFGAFGNEALKRSELVSIAQGRVPGEFENAECMIVGDSPRDIVCAKETGIRSLGVASGKYSAVELERAGADAVITTLKDIDFSIFQ